MRKPAPLQNLQKGSEVLFKEKKHVVTQVVDMTSVLILDPETGKQDKVLVSELHSATTPLKSSSPELALIPEDEWLSNQARCDIIRPLLELKRRKRSDVEARAKETGVHTNTLYLWIAAYEKSGGQATALMRKERRDRGTKKVPSEVEAIVSRVIDEEYLRSQRKSLANTYREICRQCSLAGVTPPHSNTVRKRISALSPELKTARRFGKKEAEQQHSPSVGEFPGADWPLAVVQIDHTKLDIELVDDIRRTSIGRPWITLCIDVFSRMVLGFYVTFDHPGAFSAGMCVSHAMSSKNPWLAKHEIEDEWPCWGIPKTLHMDNAKEFRGNMLQRACNQYGIDIEWRPVARPHFGAHIERLLGTLLKEIHTLPGTTFSNPRERARYDSTGRAALTLTEFEEWLTVYIVRVYHKRLHSMLGMAPIDKYREGILGTGKRPGIGLPRKIADEERLRLDFMPFEERTIQDYGVVIDDVRYYGDVLRPWINAPDPEHPKLKRKFLFRRDPRDISSIWFFDPQLKEYFALPYRDTSHPAMSIWEFREARRKLLEDGRKSIDEKSIFDAYTRMRSIETTAKEKAKMAKNLAKRKASDRNFVRQASVPTELTAPFLSGPILPFDDIEELPL